MDRFGFVVDRCGWLWVVLGRFGSFWVVLGRFGWFLVLVTTWPMKGQVLHRSREHLNVPNR